jgi:transaldolase
MKFFLDTANLDEIRQAHSYGVLNGITTNPTLVSKEGAKSFREHILKICEIVGEQAIVNAEVVATDYDGMLAEGRRIAQWAPNISVKLPMTQAGLRATRTLTCQGIRTNVTLVFSAAQALMVGKVGASYVSPFLGRIDDTGADGMELIREIATIYRNYGFKTEILAASLRHPLHVRDAAMAGADIGTMPFKVLEQLFRHPLTDKGLEQFLADWKKAGLRLD